MEVIQGQFAPNQAPRPSGMGRFYQGQDPQSFPTQIMTSPDEFYFVESEDQYRRWRDGQNPGLSFQGGGGGYSGGGGSEWRGDGGGGGGYGGGGGDPYAPGGFASDPRAAHTSLSDHVRDRAAMGTTLAIGPVTGQYGSPGTQPVNPPVDNRPMQGPMSNPNASSMHFPMTGLDRPSPGFNDASQVPATPMNVPAFQPSPMAPPPQQGQQAPGNPNWQLMIPSNSQGPASFQPGMQSMNPLGIPGGYGGLNPQLWQPPQQSDWGYTPYGPRLSR